MKIRLFRNLFYKKKIRSVKAYKKILQNGELDKVDAIKEKLLDKPLFKINKKLNNIFILGSDFDIDLSLRQYLYTHLIHVNINEVKDTAVDRFGNIIDIDRHVDLTKKQTNQTEEKKIKTA